MLLKSPWVAAVLCFFLWAVNNVFLKFIAANDINFTLFTCQTMLFASIALLAVSKPGPLSLRTFQTASTWGFGICFILEQIALLALMKHISATEAIFLGKVNIITSLLLAWVAKGRKPAALSLIGVLPLGFGLWMLLENVPSPYLGYTFAILLLYAILLSAQIFFIEVHETNNMTRGFADDARVTSLVIGITSIGLLIFIGGLSFIEAFTRTDFGEMTPTLAQALNTKSLLYAGFLGIFVASTTRYLEFVSVRQIKTEHFLALSSLSPLFTYGLERAAGFQTVVIDQHNIAAVIAILGGSFAILAARPDPEQKFSKKEQAILLQAQEQALAAMTYFGNDNLKASTALGMKPENFSKMLSAEKLYTHATYEKIKQNYDQNIASRDAVTGLQNRLSFIAQVNGRLRKKNKGVLIFLDLNKFKPVNDTYGHAAGDAILRGIAGRLTENYANAEITRLGGDEYCLMFPDLAETQVKETMSSIKKLIERPFSIEGIESKISVSASIGLAVAPRDGETAEELIKHADSAMYREKRVFVEK